MNEPAHKSITEGNHDAATIPPRQLVFLLAVALLISYVDRGNLATAAPLIKQELGLDEAQYGILASSFYWTYVAFMVPVGWATERFGAHRVLTAGILLWSVATLLTGFASGVMGLLLLRLLLGAGESAVFPTTSSLIAAHVPEQQRGSANGVISFGYLVGPAVGTVIGGLLMANFGWRPVFVLFGAVSLLWLLPWSRFSKRLAPGATAIASGEGPGFSELLAQRGLWGTSLGHFAGNYNWYFILSFMPLYLVDVRNFSMERMAWVLSGAYVVNAACALASGWFTDRWVRRGGSASLIYKGSMVVSHLVSIGSMAGMMVLPVEGAVACLFIYEIFLGFCSPATFAIGQTMAGPLAAGRWIGVQNFCGNLAGILAPAITGMLVAGTGNYTLAFLLACVVNGLGILGWGILLPRVQPVAWRATARGAE